MSNKVFYIYILLQCRTVVYNAYFYKPISISSNEIDYIELYCMSAYSPVPCVHWSFCREL